MTGQQMQTFESLLSSSNGLHLSIYIENTKRLADIRRQIDKGLETATRLLMGEVSRQKMATFLAPIQKLRQDSRLLRSFQGNIAIFRNEFFFRVVNIPVPIRSKTVVADTFHTKPIMRWMQLDQRYLLVYIGERYANVFSGDLSSFDFVDSVPIYKLDSGDDVTEVKPTLTKVRAEFVSRWINSALDELGKNVPPKLFVASIAEGGDGLVKQIKHPDVRVLNLRHARGDASPIAAYNALARREVEANLKSFARTLHFEFTIADKMNLVSNDLKEVARLATAGLVKTLLVASDYDVFGKIDPVTGSVLSHVQQYDHRDDDLLDDIAQIVKRKGGRVYVLDRSLIPGNHLITAIVTKRGELVRGVSDEVREARLSLC